MASTLFVFLVVSGFIIYMMRPDERVRALRLAVAAIRSGLRAIGYAKDAAIEDFKGPTHSATLSVRGLPGQLSHRPWSP